MKKDDILSLIMSIIVIGCLPALSAALDGDSDGGFKALKSQPSGTGSVNYKNMTGITGGGMGTGTTGMPATVTPGTEGIAPGMAPTPGVGTTGTTTPETTTAPGTPITPGTGGDSGTGVPAY